MSPPTQVTPPTPPKPQVPRPQPATPSPRDVLLEVIEAPPERVDVTKLVFGDDCDEYDTQYFIQELTGPERTDWFRDNGKSTDDANERLVILSLISADGKRVLTSADLPMLKKKSALVCKLSTIATEVSALFWRADDFLKNTHTTSPSNGQLPGGVAR